MLNREQYLLTKLAEEASELSQIALKTVQFGLDSVCPYNGKTNQELIQQEFKDLYVVIRKLNKEFDIGCMLDTDFQINKEVKIEKYYKISKDLGRAW
jgi:hypothetical protein